MAVSVAMCSTKTIEQMDMRIKYPQKFFLQLALLLLLISSSAKSYSQTQRLPFISISASQNTGQDYSPWLLDNLDSLVHEAWENNFVYVDVMLKFEYHSYISQIKLYDYTGVFEDKPAEIYALNGTQKTYLGSFTGPGYITFQHINLQQPVEADAIIIHKFSNNIPQKIFAYGAQDTTRLTPNDLGFEPEATNTNPDPVPEPDNMVKIPIQASRWYQLNNTSDGLQGLFDGLTNNDVITGYGKIFDNYDAYYPVAAGEIINLQKIKFYNRTGGLGTYPLTVAVIDSTGKRTNIGTYIGGYYNKWVGPNPGQPDNFMLDSAVTNVKYIVLNCWYQFPAEIEFYGSYQAPSDPGEVPTLNLVQQNNRPLKNYLGVNAFEWDFEDGNLPDRIDPDRMAAMRNFTQIRHYIDWQKLEPNEGGYTFNPTHSGGWNYDAMYEACKRYDIDILADLKTLPDWMINTYPEGERDSENIPVRYGADFSNPQSYIDQAKVAFQFAARYGSNPNVNSALLSVNSTPRWTNDPVNTVKIGLNLIKYIECDNERDKWWKGRKGYQTAYEYAANMSAFYDGHKNTMGAGIGVKNADPNMLVVMGGLASANTEYLKGMVEWCKTYRGYKADGTVNLCWDIINYHWYSFDQALGSGLNPTRGTAPELGITYQKALEFIEVANSYCNGMPVWVTEAGYDANPNSPLHAMTIGNKSILETQADWILRTILLYARAGIERLFLYQTYDDNYENPTQYGSSGLLNTNRTRKPAADYIMQTKKLIGNYTYKETLSTNPMVDRYEYEGQSAWVLYMPTENGSTGQYVLNVPNADTVMIKIPSIGRDFMNGGRKVLENGHLTVNVSETPIFVIPIPKVNTVLPGAQMSISPQHDLVTKTASSNTPDQHTISVYPNPSASYVNVAFNTPSKKDVDITLVDANMGRTYGTYSFAKNADDFSQTIDVTQVPRGVFLLMIKHDDKTTVKKIIKTN